jgi:hypothetical protein
MHFHTLREAVNAILMRMLKAIRTKNWDLYWECFELPEGAEPIELVAQDKQPTFCSGKSKKY